MQNQTSGPSGQRLRPGRTRILPAAVAAGVLLSLIAAPAGASDRHRHVAGSEVDEYAASFDTTDRVVDRVRRAKLADRKMGERLDFVVPRHVTGVPELFDDERPEGLSLNLPLLGNPQPGSSGEGGGFTTKSGQKAHQFQEPKDLVWSLDCDADPDTAKPYCDEPDGLYHVSGTIRHRRYEWVADPGNQPHPKAPQYEESEVKNMGLVPAREVLVRVADGCGLHADGYTDADGHYSIVFPSWCGDKEATVTLYTVSAPGAGKQVALGVHTGPQSPQVMGDLDDDPSDYTVVAGEVGTFHPDSEAFCGTVLCIGGLEMDRDFFSGEEGPLFQQGLFSREGEVARALTIMENAQMALDYYRQLVDPSRLPQINLVLTDASLQDPDNTAFFSKSKSNLIYTPPWLEWSPFAVVHETGHYFDGGILVQGGLDNYGRWGEPMANLRAGIILGSSWRVPSNEGLAEDMDVQGNWDDDAGAVLPPDDVPVSGPAQGWIWRILWDLHDGVGSETIDFGYGDFDQFDGGGDSDSPLHHLINGVVMEYLPQRDGTVHPDYVDRGQSGPDLVDMLDGFACLYGMDQLHMEVLLRDVMSYDYDFAHCNDIDNEAPAP